MSIHDNCLLILSSYYRGREFAKGRSCFPLYFETYVPIFINAPTIQINNMGNQYMHM